MVAALAVSYAGGTLVPVNSRYTGHEVADIVDRTGGRFVVVADGFLGRTQVADLRAASALAVGPRRRRHRATCAATCATRAGRRSRRVADAVSPDDVADILFTSGTTGRPRAR